MSGSVAGLQKMLDICTVYGDLCHITCNAKKAMCLFVGKLRTFNRCNMHIDGNIVPWSDKLKYLGISFVNNDFLVVDDAIARHNFYFSCNFYLSCNSFMNRCSAHEMVKLQLLDSYCLPFLTYSIGALELNRNTVNQLSVCWNDGFRKIFGFYRSVKYLQLCCSKFPFNYLNNFARHNFFRSICQKQSYVCNLVSIVNMPHKVVNNLMHKYALQLNTYGTAKSAIFNKFEQHVTVNYP